MATFDWPAGFARIPDEDWTRQPLGELALRYDTVENHGWYSNLEPTLDALSALLHEGHVLVDYSGGTGILADKLLRRVGERRLGIVLADSSPKFLRLALEKLGRDERLAFRHVRWLKAERRLTLLDEILEPPLGSGGVDALVSTNAIHLYDDLVPTLSSWRRVLKPGAPCLVQSGNIGNPAAAEDEWIIDDTVELIHETAVALVREDARWSRFRAVLDDESTMSGHAALRKKYFLPVRPLSAYRAAFREAGFVIEEVSARRIEARVEEWRDFLSAYHEGVIGWAGGSARVEGTDASDEVVGERLQLLSAAMSAAFPGSATFPCCWTYVRARAG